MDPLTLWYVVGGIVLAALVIVGFVAVNRRSALRRAEERRQLRAGEGAGGRADDGAGGVDVLERADTRTPTDRDTADPTATETAADVVVPELDRPEATETRLARLRRRLAGSNNALGRGLLLLLSRDQIDEQTWEDFEDTLITADLGVGPTTELVDTLRTRFRVEGVADATRAREILRAELLALVDPTMDRTIRADRTETPAVIMVVGVNGTGKTTTVGKLARVLVAEDKDVLLGAADTFRAAAADQLQTWGDRVGVPTVRGAEGADPASVAFEAVKGGIEVEADVVLIDTAGRLHTKTGLMDELGKVKRVIERQAPVGEVLLVLDATTGQNGLTQARIFREVVDVTGIVLTKLDGSAKGGIVVQVQRELGVPVKLVGLGEGVDDLAPFDATVFVDALLESA